MAKKVDSTKNLVLFQTCSLWQETVKGKTQQRPVLAEKIQDFLRAKEADPTKPFGSSDYAFSHILGDLGLRHAKLTADWSLLYTVSGRTPTIIKLYGIFSHDELGTGQPANIKRQKNMKQQLSNQTYK